MKEGTFFKYFYKTAKLRKLIKKKEREKNIKIASGNKSRFQNVAENWKPQGSGEDATFTSTHNWSYYSRNDDDHNVGSLWFMPSQDKTDRRKFRIFRWSHVVSIFTNHSTVVVDDDLALRSMMDINNSFNKAPYDSIHSSLLTSYDHHHRVLLLFIFVIFFQLKFLNSIDVRAIDSINEKEWIEKNPEKFKK